MLTRAAALAILGLPPGADAAAIERAYKALIKQHHPDRAGGDPGRASEINRAYRELRAAPPREDLEIAGNEVFGRRRGGWTALAILAAVASLGLVAATAWMTPQSAATIRPATPQAARGADAIEQPISTGAVDEEIQRAATMARAEGEMAMTSASRDCHLAIRRDPTIERFDRCAAFDYAVTLFQDRDPLRDRGPFSELAVTSRLMRAGSLLSNDYLAIDGRLDQIRLRTELALAPRVEPLHETPGQNGED